MPALAWMPGPPFTRASPDKSASRSGACRRGSVCCWASPRALHHRLPGRRSPRRLHPGGVAWPEAQHSDDASRRRGHGAHDRLPPRRPGGGGHGDLRAVHGPPDAAVVEAVRRYEHVRPEVGDRPRGVVWRQSPRTGVAAGLEQCVELRPCAPAYGRTEAVTDLRERLVVRLARVVVVLEGLAVLASTKPSSSSPTLRRGHRHASVQAPPIYPALLSLRSVDAIRYGLRGRHGKRHW